MYYVLSKVLPLFVMPVSLSLFGALLALILIWRRKPRPAAVCLVFSLAVLWVAALPMTASGMLSTLETRYPPLAIEDTPESDCIVLLGGAVSAAIPPRHDIELMEATDRIYQTARLYRGGKGRVIIVAAGNQPWLEDQPDEASLIKRLLIEWGVPESSIVLDGESRNTYENALQSRPLMQEAGCGTSLLVTSGWHMPRAMAVFEHAGLEVRAYAVDIRLTTGTPGLNIGLIPSADALAGTSMVIREWMGLWVYRWRGWID